MPFDQIPASVSRINLKTRYIKIQLKATLLLHGSYVQNLCLKLCCSLIKPNGPINRTTAYEIGNAYTKFVLHTAFKIKPYLHENKIMYYKCRPTDIN